MKNLYRTADHRELLEDCLKTEARITYDTAFKLIKYGIYVYYCYDERIKAHRYIKTKHYKNIGMPTWLHIYTKRKPPIL